MFPGYTLLESPKEDSDFTWSISFLPHPLIRFMLLPDSSLVLGGYSIRKAGRGKRKSYVG